MNPVSYRTHVRTHLGWWKGKRKKPSTLVGRAGSLRKPTPKTQATGMKLDQDNREYPPHLPPQTYKHQVQNNRSLLLGEGQSMESDAL